MTRIATMPTAHVAEATNGRPTNTRRHNHATAAQMPTVSTEVRTAATIR
jgi:hypothetical protein